MPNQPHELVRHTREDMLEALAHALGSAADDHRIADAYDQIISEWSLRTDDPDAEYARFFQDGPVATDLDLVAVQDWARGRILL